MTVAQRMSAEEFLVLPESEHGWPWSLVDGEVVVNDPTPLHQYVRDDLADALRDWTRLAPGRGRVVSPLDVRLDDRNVFKPNVLWYSDGRVPARDAKPPSPMPDLAVEVRSPSTWRYDIGAKKSGYERHGLPELWLVDTAAEEVLAFRRSAPGAAAFDVALELARAQRLESPLLPGFALDLSELFPRG